LGLALISISIRKKDVVLLKVNQAAMPGLAIPESCCNVES